MLITGATSLCERSHQNHTHTYHYSHKKYLLCSISLDTWWHNLVLATSSNSGTNKTASCVDAEEWSSTSAEQLERDPDWLRVVAQHILRSTNLHFSRLYSFMFCLSLPNTSQTFLKVQLPSRPPLAWLKLIILAREKSFPDCVPPLFATPCQRLVGKESFTHYFCSSYTGSHLYTFIKGLKKAITHAWKSICRKSMVVL